MNLNPTLALVVYGDAHERDHLLSLHNISKDSKGHPTLDAGRLLGASDARGLAGLLCGKEAKRGMPELFPPTLLHFDDDSVTWYRPASIATQHWRTQNGRTTFNAILPWLVFHARGRALFVAAYADPGRPDRNTPLFHAPLGNVYAGTGVCLGNVRVPASTTPADIRAWERVLLDSNYTHINHADVLRGKATNESLLEFWTKRARAKAPPAERFLAPLKRTLGVWLAEIEREAEDQEDFD